MPFTTRFWGSTAVVLCALLVQSCQPHSVSATGEEELAASPSSSTSAVRQRALSEPPAVQSLALLKEDHATLPPARALIPSASSTLASASNPSEAPHNPPATERLGAHALYNAPGDAFSSVFTASSGERVRFRQHDGQWRAVLAPGTSLNAQEHTLPVVSSGHIETLLSSLQGQDAWSSRSRIHVLATPTAPYSPCVYVGKVGLLGGAPAQRAQEPAEEWLQGPTMILGSNVKSKKGTYHIPPGYRYKACRLKAGSVVQRASLTIDYVAAENEEEYRRLEAAQNAHAAAAGVGINVGQVVTLGEIKSNVGHAAFVGHEGHDLKRTKHAGLVLYGSTKKNKVFSLGDSENKSMINIQVEILVERVGETPLVNPHGSYATGGINHGDTKPPAQDAPSPPQEREAAALQKQVAEALRKEAEQKKQAEEDRKKAAAALQKQVAEALRKEEERKKQAEEDRKKAAAALQKQAAEALRKKEEEESLRKAEEHKREAERAKQAKEANILLAKKLADPEYALSDQESITLLTHCVNEGEQNAKQIKGKDALIVIGNTGAGKSTFLNYLMGCKLQLEDPEVLGIPGLDDIVVVSADSRVKEVMPIGHTKQSKTFIPQIEIDRSEIGLAYCDCPGFLDNRGVEVNIANAVNIRRALQSAQSVKMLILINYHTLKADRVRGLRDMLLISRQLFGDTAGLTRYQGSLLLGVTQAPVAMSLSRLRSFLTKDEPPIMESLAQRTFLYDPLDRGGTDFWNRSQCLDHLGRLQGIPQRESGKLFHTVLTASDEQRLLEIVDHQGGQMREFLRLGTYPQAALCWRLMNRLCVIDHVSVERMLNDSLLRLQRFIFRRIANFREASVNYAFSEAESQLSSFGLLASQFSAKDLSSLDLDIAELTRYLARYRQKKDEEDAYADRISKLEDQVTSIADQKRMMEDQLSAQRLDFAKEQSRLSAEMVDRDAAHDDQIKKIHQEYAVMFRKREEESGLQKVLSEEERAQQQAAQARLRLEYEERLSEADREKQSVREEYEAQLKSQREVQSKKEAALQAQLESFGQQQNEVRQAVAAERIRQSLPSMAFGAQEWSKYYGEVKKAPDLPKDITQILDAPCPFWKSEGKKVRDTHLLVLIPAEVAGKPFTLNLLGELIKSPKGRGNKTKYRYYDVRVQSQVGNEAPSSSYWLLLTRDVLPGSRNKTYTDQSKILAGCASRTGLNYELPKALEAATAILTHHVRTGEHLYGDNPWTWTRCQELIRWMFTDFPFVVGGFESSGLGVIYDHRYDGRNDYNGVAGCRKFF
jgi:ribosome biogenesis GTPase A